nr:hypothetical protein PanWU01x14_308020 [Ipomoea batatas]
MNSDLTMPITQDCFSISYVPYRTMANSMANVAHKPEIKKKVTLPVQRSRDSRSMALCNAKSLSKATNMLACFDSKASYFKKNHDYELRSNYPIFAEFPYEFQDITAKTLVNHTVSQNFKLAPSGTQKFPGIVHGLILNASTPRSHELRRSLKPFPDPESDRVSLEEEFEISSVGRIIQVLQTLRHGRPCITAREGRPSRVVLETISEMPSKSGFEFLVGKNLRTLSKQALISPSPARIRGQHLLLRSFY